MCETILKPNAIRLQSLKSVCQNSNVLPKKSNSQRIRKGLVNALTNVPIISQYIHTHPSMLHMMFEHGGTEHKLGQHGAGLSSSDTKALELLWHQSWLRSTVGISNQNLVQGSQPQSEL